MTKLVPWLIFLRIVLSGTQELVYKEALRKGLDPALAKCVVQHESKWDEKAVGSHGEIGLWQILPTTAMYVTHQLDMKGYDLFDVQDNTTLGLWILKNHPRWFSTWEHCQDEVGKLDQQTP